MLLLAEESTQKHPCQVHSVRSGSGLFTTSLLSKCNRSLIFDGNVGDNHLMKVKSRAGTEQGSLGWAVGALGLRVMSTYGKVHARGNNFYPGHEINR